MARLVRLPYPVVTVHLAQQLDHRDRDGWVGDHPFVVARLTERPRCGGGLLRLKMMNHKVSLTDTEPS
jgi:hypothetical protein